MIRLIVVLLALLQGTSPPAVAVDAPAIVHVPVDRLRPGEDLVVEANVTGPRPIVRVSVGKMLHRVEVRGYSQGPVKRHGCPSHGIALSPDESELWLADAANSRVHIFDATSMPPKQLASIPLRDQPGWITFSLDGR